MRWCKKCFEPDTRPGQSFDERGICTPCQFQEYGTTPEDWRKRREELDAIVEYAQTRRSPSGYDCVIGVSGGKDSTCLALFAREVGLRPLLVCCTYPPQQFTELGAEDLSNLVSLGFDLITVNIAPEVMKRAIRTLDHALEETDHMWIPVTKAWQLNERHYGGLQGLDKQQTVDKHGIELLVDRNATVYSKDGMDLTNEVTQVFNSLN